MKRNKLRSGHWKGSAISVGVGVLLSMSSLDCIGPIQSMAETGSHESTGGYQSGHVTGKSGDSIQINQRTYPVAKDATVKDDEGRPRELKDIKEGAEVLFHLKRDTIDQLVVVLPK